MKSFKKTVNRKKVTLVLLIALGLLVPVKIGCDYYSSDYHSDLTAKVYNDTVNENINIVFYKKGCPYCQAGVSKIKYESSRSDVTTYYIDVETNVGKKLAKEFDVSHSPTLVTIRDGEVSVGYYAFDKDNKIVLNDELIEGAFE